MPAASTPSRLLSRGGYYLLKLLPPEAAHDLGKQAMKRGLLATEAPPALPVTLFGRTLPNPLGLAAGFDKNAELLARVHAYGFGFVEVGSLTFRGGQGNPKPRMFRIGRDIMNRMGLNGLPAQTLAGRLRNSPTPHFAVNVAKTHDPEIIGDKGISDVVETVRLVHDLGIYVVLNVSCPNTREGTTFEEPSALAELLSAVNAVRDATSRPLCVKLSPQLGAETSKLERVLEVCEAAGVSGYVACNTLPASTDFGRGGLSGGKVHALAVRTTRFVADKTRKPIIGVGGIFTPQDADEFLDAGATLVQAYNGFVRGPFAGPRFAFDIVNGLKRQIATASD